MEHERNAEELYKRKVSWPYRRNILFRFFRKRYEFYRENQKRLDITTTELWGYAFSRPRVRHSFKIIFCYFESSEFWERAFAELLLRQCPEPIATLLELIEGKVDSHHTFLKDRESDVANFVFEELLAYIELLAKLIRGRADLACEFVDSINRSGKAEPDKEIAFLHRADNKTQVVSVPNTYATILKQLDTRSFMVVLNEYDRLAEEVQETLRPVIRKILEDKVRSDYEDHKMGHFGVMRFLRARKSLVESILGHTSIDELLSLPEVRLEDEDDGG